MVGSEIRIRTSAATPGRDARTLDRRRAEADAADGQTLHSCPADRWVEERRAHRAAPPATRLPAFVAI